MSKAVAHGPGHRPPPKNMQAWQTAPVVMGDRFSTCSATLCHRWKRSATWIACGAPALAKEPTPAWQGAIASYAEMLEAVGTRRVRAGRRRGQHRT